MKTETPWLLLVEDDRWLAELYTSVLGEAAKLKIRHAETAEAALAMLETSQPSLILLDLFLPGFSGLELLHELASYEDTNATPIIIISSVPERDLGLSRERWRHYGVVDYIYKPTTKPRDIALSVVKNLSLLETAR